jgi:hypothetical protein
MFNPLYHSMIVLPACQQIVSIQVTIIDRCCSMGSQ